MAGRRFGNVLESSEELERLVGEYRGGSRETRLRMLLHLCEDPDATNATLAERLNVGDRTVRRWWQLYCSKGVPGLLASDDDGSVRTLSFTLPVLGRMTAGDVSERFVRFLNELPTAFDSETWVLQLQKSLSNVLDGVDRVTVAVNVGSDIDVPDGRNPVVMINRGPANPATGRSRRTLASTTIRSSPGETLIEQAYAAGVSTTEFRTPKHFDYYANGGEYVGTIILWRRRNAPSTPESTVELMRKLQGFFAFLLSDCVARQLRRDPSMRVFKDVIVAIGYRIGLSGRQLEVFLLQILGNDRAAIADQLHIAVSTVSKHISAIHTAAGTANYNELLARFLSPLSDD